VRAISKEEKDMACFLVPAAEAIVTTVVQKVVAKRAKSADDDQTQKAMAKWSQRLRMLNTMLWGGTLMMAVEHLWRGEIVPWPPFLTALESPGQVGPMLRELATYGVAMAAAVTVVWGIVVVVAERRAKAADLPKTEQPAASEVI
jgi:hypothetical protein